jgi:Outer membrane protein beta-barrel domain
MKRTTSYLLLFPLFFMLFTLSATAQFQQSYKSLDGNINLSRTPLDYVNQININIQPQYGVFLTDNWMLLSNLGINYTRQSVADQFSNLGSNELNLNFSPAIRYYFPTDNALHFFGSFGLNLNYANFNSTLTSINSQQSSAGFGANLGIGINKMIARNVAFEAQLTGIISKQHTLSFSFRNFFLDSLLRSTTKLDYAESGTMMLSGNANVFFSFDVGSSTTFNFNPSFGYFAAENILVGIIDSTSYSSSSLTGSILIGRVTPFVKYYQPIFGEHFYATIELSADVLFGHKILVGNTFQDTNFPNLNLVLGASYFLNDNMAIEADLIRFRKTYVNTSLAANPEYSTIGVNAGVHYFFK